MGTPQKFSSESIPLYRTKDLQIATVLVVGGIPLRGVEKSQNRAFFVFPSSEKISEIIMKFYSGQLLMNAKDIFSVWRGLRSMAYNITDSEDER